MVECFKKRLPGAVAVFIPSRFYASPEPEGVGRDAVVRAGRPFRVVIPGSVDGNRREYEAVLSFFTNWLTRAAPPSRAIELVILGDSDSPYGTGIVTQLQRLESPGFRLVYYSGYVPALVYEQQIASADVLWSPLRVNKKSSRHSPEIYGQTTASGLTADLLLNNAPALAPVGFVLPESFQAALLSYGSTEELEKIFVRLLEDTGYAAALRQQIHQAFSFFRAENFSAAFRSLTGFDQPPAPLLPADQEGEKGGTDAAKPPGDDRQ
jgi:hypothetical protein